MNRLDGVWRHVIIPIERDITMSEAAEQVLPLEHTWVLSEQYQLDNKQEKTKEYENSFEKLFSFNTVDDFWKYWGKIPAVG